MDWTKDNVGGRAKTIQLRDMVEVLDLGDGKSHIVRPIGPAHRQARHWFRVRKEDGSVSKPFPKMCLSFNAETGDFDGECPYCDLGNRATVEVLQNVIDRDTQENASKKQKKKERTKAERKAKELFGHEGHWKESKDTESWTPCKVLSMTGAAGRKVKDLVELNQVKTKKGKKMFAPEHPQHGFDMAVKYDKNRPATERWSVHKDERTELNEEELEYLLWQLDLEKPEKLKVAQKEAESLADRMVEDEKDEGKGGGKKRKDTSKSKKISADDDDDDEDDEDGSWGDDDDDDSSSKKKSKKSKKSSKDDDDDDDDDEDDEPKKKKKGKKSRDEDEDDDDDDDDEDDRPAKKSKKSKKSSKDDDDDEDDDDDDDEPKKKKGKSSKKSSKNDDDDDDDEDDDDEDDEPKKSKKKDKGGKSKKSAKKSRDDDDDDDDDDDGWDDDDDDD